VTGLKLSIILGLVPELEILCQFEPKLQAMRLAKHFTILPAHSLADSILEHRNFSR
jgi:hypothetical protein